MKKYFLVFTSFVALSLYACGSGTSESETADEQLDAVIENTENTAKDLKTDAESTVQELKENAENAAEAIKATAKEAAKEAAKDAKDEIEKSIDKTKNEIKGASPYAD